MRTCGAQVAMIFFVELHAKLKVGVLTAVTKLTGLRVFELCANGPLSIFVENVLEDSLVECHFKMTRPCVLTCVVNRWSSSSSSSTAAVDQCVERRDDLVHREAECTITAATCSQASEIQAKGCVRREYSGWGQGVRLELRKNVCVCVFVVRCASCVWSRKRGGGGVLC